MTFIFIYRDIQQQQQLNSYKLSDGWDIWLTYDHTTFSAVLLLCCFIVCASVVIYCRRIRKSNVFYPVTKSYHKDASLFLQDIRIKA